MRSVGAALCVVVLAWIPACDRGGAPNAAPDVSAPLALDAGSNAEGLVPSATVAASRPLLTRSPAGDSPLVDAATARRCTLTYHCGLHHPGLTQVDNDLSVDLASCKRSRLYRSEPPRRRGTLNMPPRQPLGFPGEDLPSPRSQSIPKPETTPLSRAGCERLRTLLTQVTGNDTREAREAARMDSMACTLSAQCPDPRWSVQRQTLDGDNRVVGLIRALHSTR